MTQLYFTDGTYHFQNFNVIVRNESECHQMAKDIIQEALKIAKHPERVRQTGYSCTDKVLIQ
jgi:hypothetical protein